MFRMLRLLLFLPLILAGCGEARPAVGSDVDSTTESAEEAPSGPIPDPPELRAARARMVDTQIRKIGVTSDRILDAMLAMPRHAFLPEESWGAAYDDRSVRRPDGESVTAPDLTGAMLQTLDIADGARVLECGTRSGWITALLASQAAEVLTIDARPEFIEKARNLLARMEIRNVRFRVGDPCAGWPEEGPFDAIVLTGAVPHIPKALYAMLADGGSLLAPVGYPGETQTLIHVVKGNAEPKSTRAILSVRFRALR